jgi:hypothetical protein
VGEFAALLHRHWVVALLLLLPLLFLWSSLLEEPFVFSVLRR